MSSQQSDGYLTLAQAAAQSPGRPSCNAIWRWTRKGIRSRNGQIVRLRHIRVGKRILTTAAWLRDFFAEVARADVEHFDYTGADMGAKEMPGLLSPTQRRKAFERAAALLDAEGI